MHTLSSLYPCASSTTLPFALWAVGCWLSYSARSPCVNQRFYQKWQKCPIRQEWIRFMGGHGQQAFSPGLYLSFFVCSSPGGHAAIPSGRNRSGTGCRMQQGHSGPAQTPTAALRNRKRKRKEGRKNDQKQQKHEQQKYQPEYRKTPADRKPDSCGKGSREVPGPGIRLQEGRHRFRYAAL